MQLRHLMICCAFLSLPAAAAPAPALVGLWSFDDDGTVIEFTACDDAVCAVVRRPPPKSQNPADDLKCGQLVMSGLKPEKAASLHRGWVIDSTSNQRYPARVEPDAGVLKLVISAMGGLVTETYRLRPLTGAINACKP